MNRFAAPSLITISMCRSNNVDAGSEKGPSTSLVGIGRPNAVIVEHRR